MITGKDIEFNEKKRILKFEIINRLSSLQRIAELMGK
jgi:hypothetical protein